MPPSAAVSAPSFAEDLPLPCPGCGYDLRAASSDRCPECGRPFDAAELRASAAIPWQHRGREGRRSLRRTVWMSILHPRRLAEQAGREVDYRSARRFHLLVCLLAALALAPLAVSIFLDIRANVLLTWTLFSGPVGPWVVSYFLDGLLLATVLIGLYLWVITTTGLISYFFHPSDLDRRRQDSAVALSYYAAGPLGLMPLPGLLFLAAWIGSILLKDAPDLEEMWIGAVALIGILGTVVICLSFLLTASVLLLRGLHRSLPRVLGMLAALLAGAPVLFVVWVILPFYLMLWLQGVVLLLVY